MQGWIVNIRLTVEQNFTPGDGTNDEEDLWQNNM